MKRARASRAAHEQSVAVGIQARIASARRSALHRQGRLVQVEAGALGDVRDLLRSDADPGTRDRLEVLVVAEAGCCAFLIDVTTLAIDGPEGSEPVIAAPAEALSGRPEAVR